MFYGQDLLCLGHNPTSLGNVMKMTEAQVENLILFEELFNRFSNIAVTRFDWEGLPSTVNERFMNQTLYLMGMSAFFDSEKFGLIALPCTFGGEFNIYYEPTAVNAYSFNYNQRLVRDEFVLIRNNPTCTPTAFPVFEYTRRMADTLRTIDVLCKKMKQPFIFLCEEKQRLTYLNLMKKVSDNEPIILGMKDFDIKKGLVELLDTKVDQDLVKLWEVFHSYETLLYTALGINCVDQPKRERLLVDEVNANNMVTEMSMEVSIKELETACEAINAKYGLNVSVKAKGIEDYMKGVGEDGSVYDNPSGSD